MEKIPVFGWPQLARIPIARMFFIGKFRMEDTRMVAHSKKPEFSSEKIAGIHCYFALFPQVNCSSFWKLYSHFTLNQNRKTHAYYI
jgi:sorbitol-specific phosphotransferase system component IIC